MSSFRSPATGSLSSHDGRRSEVSRTPDHICLRFLLSFLSPSHPITHDFLLRGGSLRKRWTRDGGIEEVEATTSGLSAELTDLLSDSPRLGKALSLLSMTALRKTDQGYMLDEEAVKQIRQNFPTHALTFWKTQALIVAYRACPWKYIESGSVVSLLFETHGHICSPRTSNFDSSLITPHLQYAAQTYGDCVESLSPATKADLILTLLEATRFPTLTWKRFAVSQAAAAMQGIDIDQAEYWYLSIRLTAAQSLLHRLEGGHEAAVSTIDALLRQQPPNTQKQRTIAAMGHLTLQRALNCCQVDDLVRAQQLLEEWHPLNKEPSLMEQVVRFRRDVILGRILRTRGRFSEAYTHLKSSYDLAEQLRDLTFDEDRRDLISELADSLRELDKPHTAEMYLRRELARRGEDGQDPPASGKSLLEASLAEILFAQGRTEEAERVCTEAESRANNLMKLGKLRICVVLAKIHQTRSDHEAALRYWDEAMRQVGRFPGTTGRTTRTILLSRRASMRSLGMTDTQDQLIQHTASSDALGTPGGMLYWIAGLRHWQDHLDSEATWTRM